jgi:ribosomal protein S18 acetylase RimI-like enzyme
MEFRKSVGTDVDSIMKIIRQAQAYFKEDGIDQWQNNYPNVETIENDIKNKYGYVLLENNIIIGTAAVSFDGDKNYDFIYDGKWMSSDEYAVIHRIVVDSDHKGSGLASVIIENVENMCLYRGVHSIRVDTHKENKSMQRLLQKNGFKYCGKIYLEDKSERIAFEKILA